MGPVRFASCYGGSELDDWFCSRDGFVGGFVGEYSVSSSLCSSGLRGWRNCSMTSYGWDGDGAQMSSC
ncbi:hypothetical protein Acr_04g0001540 [Actinidia rufa]|uniref:Uncharacterized protein n=1 Tax=Actinidia rufa TaxID=165716 RepID=A0A7J0EGV2_9ERIC|nr:hypothetical protein Acr_04g0001540 [Actinidia rufa]